MSTNRGKSALYSKIPFVIHRYGYNFATGKHRETQKKIREAFSSGGKTKTKKKVKRLL